MPGFIEMDSEGTEAFMGVVAGAAADLRAAWSTASDRIGVGESGVGTDRLAAAFDPPYRAGADPIRTAAAEMPGRYDDLCAAGRSCVTAYLTADRRAATAFPRGAAW